MFLTDQRVIDQFTFAIQHSSSEGASAWLATTYYKDVLTIFKRSDTYIGEICCSEQPVPISLDIQWHTIRNKYLGITVVSAVFGNKFEGTIPGNGTILGKRADITHTKVGFGFFIDKKIVWQDNGNGYVSLIVHSRNSQLLNNNLFQKFPKVNYIRTTKIQKN